MTGTEAASLDELIADCADIPRSLRGPDPDAQPAPPATTAVPCASWEVSDSCLAQVADLDEYV